MGVKVGFYTNPSFTIEQLLLKEYENFRKWTLETSKEFPDDFIQELIEFLTNTEKLETAENLNQGIVDQLVSDFIGMYCDSGPGSKLIKLHDPLLNSWRYQNDTELIKEKCGDDVYNLWKFIFNGRTIKDPEKHLEPIDQSDNFKVGYWTKDEQKFLLNSLTKCFDTEELDKENKNDGIVGIVQILKEIETIDNELILTMA